MDISQATGGSAQHLPSSSQGKDGVVSPQGAKNEEGVGQEGAGTMMEQGDVVEISSEGSDAADALALSMRLDVQAAVSPHAGDEERKRKARKRAA